MPELPDVEVFKRYIDSTSLHQKIEEVETRDEKVYETPQREVAEALEGRQLKETRRRGKHLFVRISSGRWLGLHFGMTGTLHYFKGEDEAATEHAKLILRFSDGYRLVYACPRTFGEVRLIDDPDAFIEKEHLGPDALDLDEATFKSILSDKRGGIKSALMDQEELAGIGNVYSDEILFQSGVHPETKVPDLSGDQLETIFEKMKSVLKTAIDKGADPREFPDSFLLSHREEGADCPGGKGKVKKIKVSGRNCYVCPEQQPLG